MIRSLRLLVLVSLAILSLALVSLACNRARNESSEPGPVPFDSLTAEERSQLVPDPLRYPEMQEGRLDTVDMQGEVQTGPHDGAAWHVHAINYAEGHIAITYTFFYTGPDSVALFAADRQPRLVDDRGNVYEGQLVLDNPRLAIEKGSTGVGVYVFQPALVQVADSLTLLINDSTPPVIRVGPWGVYHTPPGTSRRLEVRPGT